MAAKKPLTFDIDATPPAGVVSAPAATRKAASPPAEPLQQVGARIPKSQYRLFKADAALKGKTVQTLLAELVADHLRRSGDST